MQTPNDYLRALLLELADKAGISDSAIARAHNRAYEESTLAPSSVQRFHKGTRPADRAPSQLMQEAYAAATGTDPAENWREAIRRWEDYMQREERAALPERRSPRRKSA